VAKPRKHALAAVNTEGWMMSYADMATILLAMFIVLSTLGKDQTGASLQKGLESYRESRQNFGLPGFFSTSNSPNPFGKSRPYYSLPGDGGAGAGAGGQLNALNIDQEQERFQQFLGEMGRQFQVKRLPPIVGQATVDLFEPLNKTSPYWTARHHEFLAQVTPLLRRGDYRLFVLVWAPMAKDAPMIKAAEKAKQLADEIAVMAKLDASARGRVIAVGQTWPYADFQRPVVSLVLARTANG
jgi:hypothetical protein